MQMKERKIAVYSRKSKITGKGESIENQVEMCRRFVKEHYGVGGAEKLLVFEEIKTAKRIQFAKAAV